MVSRSSCLDVATALLDHTFGPHPPEVHHHRTRALQRASMLGEHNTWNSSAGYKLLDRYARNLPGVEILSIASMPGPVQSFPSGQKIRLQPVHESMRKWYGGRWFAPNVLKRRALVDQIKGLYIPYWTFDARVHCPWTAEAGHYYYVQERVRD